MSVDSFLRSLGLEKYSITFQAEEVYGSTAFFYMLKISICISFVISSHRPRGFLLLL